MDTKRCTKCGKVKALDQFRLVKKGSPTRRTTCNDCYRDEVNERRDVIRAETLSPYLELAFDLHTDGVPTSEIALRLVKDGVRTRGLHF